MFSTSGLELEFSPSQLNTLPISYDAPLYINCVNISRGEGGEAVKPPSCFRESSLTPEQIANKFRDEIKRMKKRRQIVGMNDD